MINYSHKRRQMWRIEAKYHTVITVVTLDSYVHTDLVLSNSLLLSVQITMTSHLEIYFNLFYSNLSSFALKALSNMSNLSPFFTARILGVLCTLRSVVFTCVLAYFTVFGRTLQDYSSFDILPFQVYVLFSYFSSVKLVVGFRWVSSIPTHFLRLTLFVI